MMKSQDEEKKAVDCGYWQLYRYNPENIDAGKNPFTLDSKEPTGDYKAFLLGETRYASLMKARPELAEELFAKTEQDSKVRLESYKNLAKND
jgi:pyruvate-ferredoxin/flavodoxin oxidoreductase